MDSTMPSRPPNRSTIPFTSVSENGSFEAGQLAAAVGCQGYIARGMMTRRYRDKAILENRSMMDKRALHEVVAPDLRKRDFVCSLGSQSFFCYNLCDRQT